MRTISLKIFAALAIISFFTSCAPSRYMQIATLKSEQVKLQSNGSFTWERPEFTIKYDFWSTYGDVGFMVTNNSDEDLYLNLEKSYFINNGYAFDYYQNRVIVHSSKSSLTTNSGAGVVKSSTNISTALASSSSTYSSNETVVEYIEDKIVCIPAHSSKYFKEFQAASEVYRECGFQRDPSKEENAIVEFEEDNSPKVFENRLMFTMGDKEIPVTHKFYVCELQNISYNNAHEYVYAQDCNGNNISPAVSVNQKASSNKYYIYYYSYYIDSNDRIK